MDIHRRRSRKQYPVNYPLLPENLRCAMGRLVRRIETCRRGAEQMVLDRGGPARTRYAERLHVAIGFLAVDGTPKAVGVSVPSPLAVRAKLVWGGPLPPPADLLDILCVWLPVPSEPWGGLKSSSTAWHMWQNRHPSHWR